MPGWRGASRSGLAVKGVRPLFASRVIGRFGDVMGPPREGRFLSRRPKDRPRRRPGAAEETANSELTPSQLEELKRRIKEMDDPKRFFLASVFTPSFVLYYNVADDVFVMNNPAHATVFKRQAVAEAVRRNLGEKIVLLEARKKKGGEVKLLPGVVRKAAMFRGRRQRIRRRLLAPR